MYYLGLDEKATKGLFVQSSNVYAKESEYLNLWFRKLLKIDFSFNGEYKAVAGSNKRLMADIVSTKSSLPLKARESLEMYSGKIPKNGMKFVLDEDEILQLEAYAQLPDMQGSVVKRIFGDVETCINGVEYLNEYNTLALLSNDAYLAHDPDNTKEGEAVRIKYDTKVVNAKSDWSTAAASTIRKDINDAIKEAKKNKGAKYVFMSDATLDILYNSKLAVEIYSQKLQSKDAPIPTVDQFKESFKSVFRIEIIEIDSTFEVQRDGKNKTVKPFRDNVLTFVPSLDLGRLAWANTGEHIPKYQSKKAAYHTVNTYTLISQHSDVEPLEFFTRGMARTIPVLDEIDNMIFLELK